MADMVAGGEADGGNKGSSSGAATGAAAASTASGIELFVPGRICLFGEHSDWAGGYRRFNADIAEGCALVCGTTQGLYARARKLPESRTLVYCGTDGSSCELMLDDLAHLKEVALSSSLYSYIAGTVLELGKHFRVGGAEIVNYRADLPIKKGLSSSAAICVLIVRALNQLYDLKLTAMGEMDIAYRGEIQTPSRCGRLDQCVAFGQAVTKMLFDGDQLLCEPVRVAATLYLVIVDLCASKDTKEILKCLNAPYPFPKDEQGKALANLLGEVNLQVCAEVTDLLSKERDPVKAAERLGALMSEAQGRWDSSAAPLCPHELTAPVLHRLLSSHELQPHITGGKGVGSQGDGTAQLVCRTKAAQDEVMKIVQQLGMQPLRLTIAATKAVRVAVLPLAGFCAAMWPATKCCGPWLFPIRQGEAVKPAICWICEELIAAEIDRIIFVVNEATEAQMVQLFRRREDIANLNHVPAHIAIYDEELIRIGERITFVRQERPTGIRDAVLLCESVVNGEAFLLAWGDHICSSTAPDGTGCFAQLLAGFDGSRSVASMHCVDQEAVSFCGIFGCREPPRPLPPPLGPRPAAPTQAAGSSAAGPTVVRWPLSRVAEKPTLAYAEAHLQTPSLPSGQYLGSFGQYVLRPKVFQVLRNEPRRHFTEALDVLRQQDGMDGVLIEGRRWDLGTTRTYIEALEAQAGWSETPGSAAKRPRVT